jgi:hypothetical protein
MPPEQYREVRDLIERKVIELIARLQAGRTDEESLSRP